MFDLRSTTKTICPVVIISNLSTFVHVHMFLSSLFPPYPPCCLLIVFKGLSPSQSPPLLLKTI